MSDQIFEKVKLCTLNYAVRRLKTVATLAPSKNVR